MPDIRRYQWGVVKGTRFEEPLKEQARGESASIGWYLAAAKQAEIEGLPEVARALRDIAWEDANHAATFVELTGGVSMNTRDNLAKAYHGETESNKVKLEFSRQAREDGLDGTQSVLTEAAQAEQAHARTLKTLLDKHFSHNIHPTY